jgi:hypothetical protein
VIQVSQWWNPGPRHHSTYSIIIWTGNKKIIYLKFVHDPGFTMMESRAPPSQYSIIIWTRKSLNLSMIRIHNDGVQGTAITVLDHHLNKGTRKSPVFI